jgi:hypothetical protein
MLRHRLAAATWLRALLLVSLLAATSAIAQSRNLAPDFTALPKDSTVLLAPLDVELFSLSAGGVPEPRADWTQAALKHMKGALQKHKQTLGVRTVEIDETTADELGELLSLHAAVASAISLHHFGGINALPTKEGRLEWSFGDALQPLQKKAGARYALFTFVRDSYASAERIAAMAVMALLGVGLTGGVQVGYASLVDLQTGQVLWFNQLVRASGDLREADKAAETVVVLLRGFPGAN